MTQNNAMYPNLMRLLNCTRETKIATIFYISPTSSGTPLRKALPITVEQLDTIPEIADALTIYNDQSLKKEHRIEAMRFISERVQDFLYMAIYPESNSVALCEKYLGLPGYEEMDKLVSEQLAVERQP